MQRLQPLLQAVACLAATPPVAGQETCSAPILADVGVSLPLVGHFGSDRLTGLEGVMNRLAAGTPLQVVTLGDSIVGDNFGPQLGRSGVGTSTAWGFDLIAGHYGADISTVVSVLGSTGAWYYRDAALLQQYVLAFAPDLLVIGGISNRGDIDAIRSVIVQTRAALPDVEILLMTGAVDLDEVPDGIDLDLEPEPGSWRAALRSLATEQGTAFLDLRVIYDRFVAAAHAENPFVDHLYFQRDAVHANTAGRIVLRQAVTSFFLPDRACEWAVSATPPDGRTASVVSLVEDAHGVLDLGSADFDRDGAIEVVMSHGSKAPSLYRLTAGVSGPAQFVATLGQSLQSEIGVGDLTGDGRPDVLAGAVGLPMEIHTFSGDSESFVTLTPGSLYVEPVSAFDIGDYDDDGRQDITVAGALVGDRLYLNRAGDGTAPAFEPFDLHGDAFETTDIRLVDVDDDSRLDIVTASAPRMPNTPGARLLLNRGFAGGFPDFAEVPIAHGVADARKLAFGDVDGDGDPDIAVGTGRGHASIHLYLQSGAPGQFEATPVRLPKIDPNACIEILEIADYDNDGYDDVVAGGSCQAELDLRPPGRGVYYFRRIPHADGLHFEPPSWLIRDMQSLTAVSADVDADGIDDFLVADGAAGAVGGRLKAVLGAFTGPPPAPGPEPEPGPEPDTDPADPDRAASLPPAGGGAFGWSTLALLLIAGFRTRSRHIRLLYFMALRRRSKVLQ